MNLIIKTIIKHAHCSEEKAEAIALDIHSLPGFYWNSATEAEMIAVIKSTQEKLNA